MTISTAVDLSAVARVVGIQTQFQDLRGSSVLFLPQRLAVVGQGSSTSVFDLTKFTATNAADVGRRYGFGSPLHIASLRLLPVNGDGVGTIPVTFYPLEDGTAPAIGDITPTVAATQSGAYSVNVSGTDSEQFVITAADTATTVAVNAAAAINAILEMPVIATANAGVIALESKWAGESANDILVSIEGPTDAGVTFAITQPTGGLVNPDVDQALARFGNVWESMAINCLNLSDTDTLDKYQTFGEGRWGALVRRPLVVFTGDTESDVNAATTVSDARRSDRINSKLVAPGSPELPFAVAAREIVRVIRTANNNPARDYGSLTATGLTPGADGDQWTYPQRDQAVKGGSSTIEVKDGVITLSDIVTFYHPTGDALPAYRYVSDIVKVQNILFNLDLIFANEQWDGAPLIPNDQPTSNRTARKPRDAVAAVAGLIDSLAENALISDPETAKASIMAQISAQNPKRLDLKFTVQLSGTINILSIDFNFGFFFGTNLAA